MLRNLKNAMLYYINGWDKRYSLHIFPRDIILKSTTKDFKHYTTPEVFLDAKSHGFDMLYYCCSFTEKETYFCFHGTKRDYTYKSHSYIVIIDSNKKIVLTLAAKDLNLEHFYSPQIIWHDEKRKLFFCALTQGRIHLFWVDITGFADNKQKKLVLKDIQEQHIFREGNMYLVLYTKKNSPNILLKETRDFKIFTDREITLKHPKPYKFANNPSMIKVNGVYYLFCRISYRNALDSFIACFTSKDLASFDNKKINILNNDNKIINHAFPYITKENTYTLYYTQYWGEHLLKRWTLKNWEHD